MVRTVGGKGSGAASADGSVACPMCGDGTVASMTRTGGGAMVVKSDHGAPAHHDPATYGVPSVPSGSEGSSY